MECDRSWIQIQGFHGRQQEAYQRGVREFLDFAFKDVNPTSGIKLRCPCQHCQNYYVQDHQTMRFHLFRKGIKPDYNPWIFHGEEEPIDPMDGQMDEEEESDDYNEEDPLISDEMASLVNDMMNANDVKDRYEGSEEIPDDFDRLKKESEEPLYPGCKTYSKLSFIVTLLHLKVSGRWSNKSFTGLLSALHKAFNYDPCFPKTYQEGKMYTRKLGLNYVKIHACVNHCILYRKEYADVDMCPSCHEPRWQEGTGDVNDSATFSESQHDSQIKSRIHQLVLRYFPLTPRLQRLYITPDIAKHMRWHKEKRQDDGILRHPADSMAWKKVDEMYPDFAIDPRNVRLGLAADGFHPGNGFGKGYSIWPVFLVPYNLPSWLFIQSPYVVLSLLIPGPKQPGNDIDVFLDPLIDELKELWEVGVQSYDSYSHKTFNMRVALMWTINDFPAYASLSGWSTSGKLACPSCHKHTCYVRLKHGCKQCFLGHRRFLDPTHRWRNDKKSFNGAVDRRPPPVPLLGDEILETLYGIPNVKFGKAEALKRKRGERYLVDQWKKRSVFFRLPYWSKLLIRHNLDVMHIEKNICDNILGTVLDIPGKTKDNLSARLDIKELNMHKEFHPIEIGDTYVIPKAPYQLTLAKRKRVLDFLSKVKVPDAYSSNISRCASLDGDRIVDMKSHDCHVFMQDLLIPTFLGILPNRVLEPLAELSLFFKRLCSKTLNVDALENMEKSITVTLCKIERIFVASFFDVMVHLTVHLASETRLASPMQGRWMFRHERGIRNLKSYVNNKARPEGSIAEGYIMDECVTFCSRYFNEVETKFNRISRNDMDEHQLFPFEISIFQKKGSSLGKRTFKELSHDDWNQAQLYILRNCPEVQPFVEEYASLYETQQDLVDWFRSRIWKLHVEGDKRVKTELLSLSRGPSKSVTSYSGYFINGYRFHTKKRQRRRKTQNSGVVVKGDGDSGQLDFFGVLKEVIEVEYDAVNIGDKEPTVVLFRCTWSDVYNEGRGIKRDKFGTISVNIKKHLPTNEPFALASQIKQVYYVKAHNEADWRIVINTIPCNFYNFPIVEDEPSEDEHGDIGTNDGVLNIIEDDAVDDVLLPRLDVPSEIMTADGEVDIIEEEESDQEEEIEQEEDDEYAFASIYELDSNSDWHKKHLIVFLFDGYF